MAGCAESLGFFPCSTSLGGSAFLLGIYGWFLFYGANLLSIGADLLSDLKWSPALIGGLVLPVLGALPDSLMVLISGLKSNDAVDHVAVGVGTLTGSSIMLITIVWGGSILLGRCDLGEDGLQINRVLTDPIDMVNTGVSTDAATPKMAWFMIASSLLFLIVQLPDSAGASDAALRRCELAGAILCFLALAGYCAFQVVQPQLVKRAQEAKGWRFLRYNIVRSLSYYANRYGGILTVQDTLSRSAVAAIFNRFDRNKDGKLDRGELALMLCALELGASPADAEAGGTLQPVVDYLERELLSAAPSSAVEGGVINEQRFHALLARWFAEKQARFLQEVKPPPVKRLSGAAKAGRDHNLTFCVLTGKAPDHHNLTQALLAPEDAGSDDDGPELNGHAANGHANGLGHAAVGDAVVVASVASHGPSLARGSVGTAGTRGATSGLPSPLNSSSRDNSTEASGSGGSQLRPARNRLHMLLHSAALLAAGAAICGVFADPFVSTISEFSARCHVPSFFVAFVIAPLASNASELISSLKFAMTCKSKHISVTFNQVYGAVTMNNTLGLGLLYLVCHVNRLQWQYTTETLVTLVASLALGALAVRNRAFRALWGLAALSAYPLVLLAIYILKYRLHIA